MLSNLQAQQKLLQFSSSTPPLPSQTLPSPTLPSPSQSNNNVKDFLSLASLVGARDTKVNKCIHFIIRLQDHNFLQEKHGFLRHRREDKGLKRFVVNRTYNYLMVGP